MSLIKLVMKSGDRKIYEFHPGLAKVSVSMAECHAAHQILISALTAIENFVAISSADLIEPPKPLS